MLALRTPPATVTHPSVLFPPDDTASNLNPGSINLGALGCDDRKRTERRLLQRMVFVDLDDFGREGSSAIGVGAKLFHVTIGRAEFRFERCKRGILHCQLVSHAIAIGAQRVVAGERGIKLRAQLVALYPCSVQLAAHVFEDRAPLLQQLLQLRELRPRLLKLRALDTCLGLLRSEHRPQVLSAPVRYFDIGKMKNSSIATRCPKLRMEQVLHRLKGDCSDDAASCP